MSTRSRLFVIIVLGLAVVAAAAAEEPYDGAHFKRATLVVADLERSLQIYRDILGFDLDGISTSSDESYSYPVFRIDPQAKIRFATLSAGSEQVRTLALTEVTGVELPKPGVPLMSAVVIRVDDLAGTMERIEKLGLEINEPKTAGRPGEFSFVEQAFVDFDGHLVVLYQILETAAE
jgi:catechol 2,3-dioxygenase-like lactoylglutathione lyase family enzyme